MNKKIEKEIKELNRLFAGVAALLTVAMLSMALFLPHIPEGFFI